MEDNLINKKRIDWIDIAKALVIYIMVCGHVGMPKDVNTIINSFHMPIFFILSGYCFNEKRNIDTKIFFKKRFCSLLIPYLFLGPVLYLLLDGIYFILNQPENIKSIENLVYHLFYNPANAEAFGIIQWFLVCLFLTEIVFYFIGKITKWDKLKCGIVIVLFSFIGYFYPKLITFRLPFAADTMLMAILFYGIGWLSRTIDINKITEFVRNHKLKTCILEIILSIIFGISIFYNGYVNMRITEYNNYFLFVINVVSYSLILIVFSILIDILLNDTKIKNFIILIGRNTLGILVFNQFVKWIIFLFYNKLIENMNSKIIYILNLFIAFVIVLICLEISILINEYIPELFGKRREISKEKTC